MTESPTIPDTRLQALATYELLDTLMDPALDDFTRLAARLCNVPAAAITLLKQNRVVIASSFGLDSNQDMFHTLPCEVTLAGHGVHQIPDARVPHLPLGNIVAGHDQFLFYAGAPMRTPSGTPIGCLCVLDTSPRDLTGAQAESLASLSEMIVARLDLNLRVSRLDKGSRATHTVSAPAEIHSRRLLQNRSLLEAAGDGMFGMDLNGCITVVNPAAAQMLGYRPNEILGKSAHDLLHHSYPDGTPYPKESCPIEQALVAGKSVRVTDEVFWRKDGTCFPVEYVARPQLQAGMRSLEGVGMTAPRRPGQAGADADRPIQTAWPENTEARTQPHALALVKFVPGADQSTPRSRAVGVVVAFTDLTRRNALDRMQDEFVSTVSHELRTPLTSLRASLGLIAGGALAERPEKMAQMMEIALTNTDRLVELINDILDLERINSGKVHFHPTLCQLDPIFRRAAAALESRAAKANVWISIEANRIEVWADPERIFQTLSNLLSNAIKFSKPNIVASSEIRMLAQREGVNKALIQIQDQGSGIPEEKLHQIFERFRQIDASDSRAQGGTGLGLAICRSIIAQHGGRIWATSKLGEGSTLHFTLPTRPPAPKQD